MLLFSFGHSSRGPLRRVTVGVHWIRTTMKSSTGAHARYSLAFVDLMIEDDAPNANLFHYHYLCLYARREVYTLAHSSYHQDRQART